MNNIIPYQFILVLIIVIIFIIIILTSVSYNNEDETIVKSIKNFKSKGMNNTQIIRPEIINNCYILNINDMNMNTGYSISGIYTNSCISVYKNGERITNYKCDGYKNIVLSCNENITTPLYKLSKYKVLSIPLKEKENYKIVIDYIKDIKVQQYNVNINIDYTPIPLNYPKIDAYNEYDIDLEVRKNYSNIKREPFDNYKSPSEWFFYKNGARYVLVTVKNKGNYDIILNDKEEVTEYRTTNRDVELIYTEIENPNIKMINLDYIAVKKDINTEYIDLVTSPNYLLRKFLYGDKYKDINYSMYISNKCIIYKIE